MTLTKEQAISIVERVSKGQNLRMLEWFDLQEAQAKLAELYIQEKDTNK